MWGPISKRDERRYRRLGNESAARAKRIDADSANMPRKLEIMRRVKSGEITLKAAQSALANDGTQRPGDADATNATSATPPGSLK